MHRKTISPDQWKVFCEGFGRQHRDWLVTIKSIAPDGRSRLIANDMPLKAIAAGNPGRHPEKVVLMVGRGQGGEKGYEIESVKSVVVEETDEGAHRGLIIESSDGSSLYFQFRSAVLTEMVDGSR